MMLDRRVADIEYERYPILKPSMALCQCAIFFPQLSLAGSDLAIGNRLDVLK